MSYLKDFYKSLKEIFIYDVSLEEKTIDVSTNESISDIKFHINAKESKPIEILLQQMFSNEFDIAQEDLKHKKSIIDLKSEDQTQS